MIRCEKRAGTRKKGVATYMLRIIINCACATYHIQMWDWDKGQGLFITFSGLFLEKHARIITCNVFHTIFHLIFQMICDMLMWKFPSLKISSSIVQCFLLKACCGICQRWMGSHTIVSWAQDPPRVTLSLSLALTKG